MSFQQLSGAAAIAAAVGLACAQTTVVVPANETLRPADVAAGVFMGQTFTPGGGTTFVIEEDGRIQAGVIDPGSSDPNDEFLVPFDLGGSNLTLAGRASAAGEVGSKKIGRIENVGVFAPIDGTFLSGIVEIGVTVEASEATITTGAFGPDNNVQPDLENSTQIIADTLVVSGGVFGANATVQGEDVHITGGTFESAFGLITPTDIGGTIVGDTLVIDDVQMSGSTFVSGGDVTINGGMLSRVSNLGAVAFVRRSMTINGGVFDDGWQFGGPQLLVAGGTFGDEGRLTGATVTGGSFDRDTVLDRCTIEGGEFAVLARSLGGSTFRNATFASLGFSQFNNGPDVVDVGTVIRGAGVPLFGGNDIVLELRGGLFGTIGLGTSPGAGAPTINLAGTGVQSVSLGSSNILNLTGGGVVDRIRTFGVAEYTITGSDFVLNGQPVTEITQALSSSTFEFTAVLPDGGVVIHRGQTGDEFAAGTITLDPVAVPPIDTVPQVVTAGQGPAGLRPGESLTLGGDADLDGYFGMIDATLAMEGDSTAGMIDALRSDITLAGNAWVANAWRLHPGSTLHMTGGSLGVAPQSVVRGNNLGDITVAGGAVGRMTLESGGTLAIEGGSVEQVFSEGNGATTLSGGALDFWQSAQPTDTLEITGGAMTGLSSGLRYVGVVTISGGTVEPISHQVFGELDIMVTEAAVDGVPLNLTLGQPTTVTDRGPGIVLTATLADGSSFAFELDVCTGAPSDPEHCVFPGLGVVTVTLVPPIRGADLTTDGTSNGIPDGAVTLSDFSYYLSLWGTGDLAADYTTDGTSNGVPDGVVTLSDFSFYLTLWGSGTP